MKDNSLHPECVCHCCLPPDLSARNSCDHLQWRADGSAAKAAGDVCSTSMDRQRERHDFHRFVGHIWQMRSSSHSTACWCGSGAICGHSRFCASCAEPHQHRVYGQWLPDMSHPQYQWCCVCTHDCSFTLRVDSDGFVTARIRIRRTDCLAWFPILTVFNVGLFHIVLH